LEYLPEVDDGMTHGHGQHDRAGNGHHAHMVADFRRRFWISLGLTVPVLALAPLIQRFLGIGGALAFRGDSYVQALFATAIYFYGGWPFLEGFIREIGNKKPGMMTLISLAITVRSSSGSWPH
jgi:Cu2+-exporting ATPase